jgi:uncharacterized protein (TIGR03085 family)
MTPPLPRRERQTLVDLFTELGPDAPTLCAGWSTADLAAHLVARERRPDSGPGLVWPPLAAYTERVRVSIRDRLSWEDLVDRVASGPPPLLRAFDAPMNTVEFFIHVEDVRRAREGWQPRVLSPELADALWKRVGPGQMAKRVAATIELAAPGREAKVGGSGPRLLVSGDPGEHVVFGAGRQDHARVSLSGEPELVAALQACALGV